MTRQSVPLAKDKSLFTPGPLTTSSTVKQAMLRDLGSRDMEFIDTLRQVRTKLLGVAGVSQEDGYEAVLLQGSGTFGIEAVMTATLPREDGKWLIVINGAYGERMVKIATVNGLAYDVLRYPENTPPAPADVEAKLQGDRDITHVAIVHYETTSGIMNPIEAVGEVVKRLGRVYFVDSMSAFGAVVFDLTACGADYLVSSANKCIEGVPGFSFVICRRGELEKTEGFSRTLTLDLYAQWKGLENNGQFRFTPPTHTILAFHRALDELAMEGGVPGREARYRENWRTLAEGMQDLGFQEYLPRDLQAHIITSFLYPQHPNFDFERFYEYLSDRGHLIYPGKVTQADCFRIGNIGRLFASDVKALLLAIRETMEEMGVPRPEAGEMSR